jgi:hypothetical protein
LPSILERAPAPQVLRVAALAGAMLADRDRAARAVSPASEGVSSVTGARERSDSWKQAARLEGLRN